MRTVKLGDICLKIGSGATPKGGKNVYTDTGTALIRSQNVHNLDFVWEGLARISDDAASKLANVALEPNDVLLNITGDSVARVCLVPEEALPARVNQHVAIVRPDPEILDPRYLVLYLASPYMQSYMLNRATGKGASRNAITKDMIASFEVPAPALDTQRKTIARLSAYDSLIENNRKQIKLLEEAAQRLYKEWFIDLRFPGHESVEIDPDTGLPEGWKESAFLDEVSFVRGKSYNADNLVDASEQQLINLSNIAPFGGWLPGGEKPYSGNCRADQIVSSGDILLAVTDMTKERRLVGHAAMVPRSLSGSVISMDLIKLNPNNIAPMYLYCLLRFSGVASMISMLANGTNVLHLKPESMNRVRILVPNLDVQGKFSQLVKPLFASIDCLSEQITIASEARNRLLPELLGGTDD